MSRRRRKRHDAARETSRGKGDALEAIVELMHHFPGAKVERNVFLPAVRDPSRTREIDVLISGLVGGYPVRIAIECRNVSSLIEVGDVGEFIDKLKDVGIPVQHGVFVSASQFRRGALRRANELGLRTLRYEDVSSQLPAAVSNAIQSIIFTLLTIASIRITSDKGGPAPVGEILFFRDVEGNLKGSVPDLVWRMWRDAELDEQLGDHSVQVELPSGWLQIVGGEVADVKEVHVDYAVTAHVVDFPGNLTHHHLIDQQSNELARFQIEATFDPPDGRYPVSRYSSEADLDAALRGKAVLQVASGRIRLPRIRWMSLYWPPSKKAMDALMAHLRRAIEAGEDFDLTTIGIDEIEGSDLKALWDPIIPDHPMVDDIRTSGHE